MMSEENQFVSEALKAEESLRSHWYILNLEGNLVPVADFNFTGHDNLRKFSGYETDKKREAEREPPHVDLMRRLELVDYEPASDPGNMRYYPKGRMVKALLEDYVSNKVLDYGGMEVETPIMYNMRHPTLSEYLNRFPARQYSIESDDDQYFLRFAACFGQFLMSRDAVISYRNLPMRIYELTRYSFRREQRGELTGLRRLRAFTMPDVHAFCSDLTQAKEEFIKRFELSQNVLSGIGLEQKDYELGVRLTQDFWEENSSFVIELVKKHGKPALIEMWNERFFYFILKWEMNFVDTLDKASALATDQIDVENAERYEIKYMNEHGEQKYPLILHCSPSGAIERDIYALLEKAAIEMSRGNRPCLPLWLSPTQVRFIPVSQDYVNYTEKLTAEIDCIRIDIDNRDVTVAKKVRDAEKEWIPYIVVIGEKEVDNHLVPVRIRSQRLTTKMTIAQLIDNIKNQTTGKPYRPLPMPLHVQDRPKFLG